MPNFPKYYLNCFGICLVFDQVQFGYVYIYTHYILYTSIYYVHTHIYIHIYYVFFFFMSIYIYIRDSIYGINGHDIHI